MEILEMKLTNPSQYYFQFYCFAFEKFKTSIFINYEKSIVFIIIFFGVL